MVSSLGHCTLGHRTHFHFQWPQCIVIGKYNIVETSIFFLFHPLLLSHSYPSILGASLEVSSYLGLRKLMSTFNRLSSFVGVCSWMIVFRLLELVVELCSRVSDHQQIIKPICSGYVPFCPIEQKIRFLFSPVDGVSSNFVAKQFFCEIEVVWFILSQAQKTSHLFATCWINLGSLDY